MNFKQATTQMLILSVIQRGALQTHRLQHWGAHYLGEEARLLSLNSESKKRSLSGMGWVVGLYLLGEIEIENRKSIGLVCKGQIFLNKGFQLKLVLFRKSYYKCSCLINCCFETLYALVNDRQMLIDTLYTLSEKNYRNFMFWYQLVKKLCLQVPKWYCFTNFQ